MQAATSSIEQLLALARQRRLWPEVEQPAAPTVQSAAAAPLPALTAATEVEQAFAALLQEAAQALGPRLVTAQPLLDQVAKMISVGSDRDRAEALEALDELEDLLEALSQ